MRKIGKREMENERRFEIRVSVKMRRRRLIRGKEAIRGQ